MNSQTGITDTRSLDPVEILMAQTLDKAPSGNYIANMYYKFVPSGTSNLSADISLGTYSNLIDTEQPNNYYDAGMNNILRSVNSRYDSDTKINLWSALVDYEKKFKQVTLSAGAKYSHIKTDNQLAFFNIQNGQPVFDVNRSNEFSYLENIAALYFIFNARPTDKVSVNLGMRVENTASLGLLESEVDASDGRVGRDYTNFFPNASISYDNKKNSVFTASFGRRITRPNYQGLNFGIRKDFLNRKLLVQLTGNDIFRTNTDFYYTSNYGGIITDGVRSFDNQRFGFSLTYNFGNQQAKARRNRSTMDEELRRISE